MHGDQYEETEMATLAARFVNSTNRHVFLTGKAGTGKTTFLHKLAASTHKRYVILAPTGIAALNAKGVTIHSQFLFPFGAYLPEKHRPLDIPEHGAFHDQDTLTRRHPLNAIRRNVLRELDLLIIDEVSMLRADVLDAIDFRMRAVRQNRNQSFGGAQVLLIGDLYQLPPVVKEDEWRVMQRYYASMHFFESHVMRQHGYAHIELDRIFRQQDGNFIHILNNLRNNTVTQEDVTELNKHYKATISEEETEGVITLTTHNYKADELNQRALAKLPGKLFTFDAEIEPDFPESMYPVLQRIELKVGAQIMFVKNDMEKAYFNGKLAKVVAIDKDGITVRMDPGSGTGVGEEYKLKREIWENKRYVVNTNTKQQDEEVIGSFQQYPIKLAWAITVHKSQGLTFSKAIIDVGSAFAPGQVYVALSRLRSLDGLILRTRIDPSVVSNDKDVVAFTQRGTEQQPLPDQLAVQQREYLRLLLSGTFDFGDLLRKVEYTQKDHPETAEFEDERMKTALKLFQEKLRSEEENTQKFRGQLMRLLQEDKREELLVRIEKGGAYYGDMLQAQMKALFQHMAQAEMLSRTKDYANSLKEIDGMLMKKVSTIAKVGYLAKCILDGTTVEKRPELEKGIAAKRAAMVGEARAWAEENKPKTKSRTGRKRLAEGDEGWEEFNRLKQERTKRTGKKPTGATYETTYALVKAGFSLEQVAAERSMAKSTIEGHFARGIEEGALEINALMPEVERDAIATWMRENPTEGLNAVAGHFEGRFSYGKLRMVSAWVKREA